MAALYHYTQGNQSAFRQLNNQLRKGNLNEFNMAFSNLLSSALSKIEPKPATVYRTIRLNKTNLQAWLQMADFKSGITFTGFTSTSLSKKVVEEFANAHTGKKRNETDILLVIKGKSGKPINDFSQFNEHFGRQSQQELLFDKGMRLRFLRWEFVDEKHIFYMEEL